MATVPSLGNLTDVLSAPIGDLIASVGRGVAAAQHAMDAATLESLQAIYAGQAGDAFATALRDIGYRPAWYQIPEVTAEISVALTLDASNSAPVQPGSGPLPPSRPRLSAVPVDASYTSRFSYDLRAASKVTFRIVPVPPSVQAEAMKVVPTLVGLLLGQARDLVTRQGFALAIAPAVEPAPLESAQVVSQSPAAGTLTAAAPAMISITVS